MKSMTSEGGARMMLQRAILFLMAVLIAGCGAAAPTTAPVVAPCVDPASASSAGGGAGVYLFYKGCGLWAVDPANLTAPVQVEKEFSSLQTIGGGTWNSPAQKVTDRGLRYLFYVKTADDGKGHFYKISALMSDPLVPTQVSNEGEADQLCSISALPDYNDINNTLIIYTLPGKDEVCSPSDDNLEKRIRLAMGPSDSPVTIDRTNPDVHPLLLKLVKKADYDDKDETVTNVSDDAPNTLFPLIDLVDKNTGIVPHWLVIKPRLQKLQPEFEFKAYDEYNEADKNTHHNGQKYHKVLETQYKGTRYGNGFSEGTPVQISGHPDFDPTIIYRVHLVPIEDSAIPDDPARGDKFLSTTKFQLYQPVKRTVHYDHYNRKGETKPGVTTDSNVKCRNLLDDQLKVTREEAECIPLDPGHFQGNLQTGKIQRIGSFIDLYRCDLDLANCGEPLKKTEFQTLCKLSDSGDNQLHSADSELDKAFYVQVTDALGQPVPNVPIKWEAEGGAETSVCLDPLSGFTCVSQAEITAINAITDGEGKSYAKGKLGPKSGKSNNSFKASIDGMGAPLIFTAGAEAPIEPPTFSPSCKVKEDFLMIDISPQGYGNLFSGQMVIRIDLQYKPDPNNKDIHLADKEGTEGLLYTYNIDTNTLSPLPQYTSKVPIGDGSTSAFPDGLLFTVDGGSFYFTDRGSSGLDRGIYSLPLDGSKEASLLVSEGAQPQFTDLALTNNRVVYSMTDKTPTTPTSTLKSVGKGGGAPATLLQWTTATLLPIMTAGDFVYFQTLGAAPPAMGIGVASTIYTMSGDGATQIGPELGSFAGRTQKKIFKTINCSPKPDCDLTFSSANGALLSIDALNPFAEAINLGTVPPDIAKFFFNSVPSDEGSPFFDDPRDEVMGEGGLQEGVGSDIFYIRANQAGSLMRVTNTSNQPESLP